ncbi:hypothetical protein [Geobacillus subterraneus]|uniref:hypothetical protein n=1 Tax=Geobacillus subterraneus TaxID=129338 RepID=UPI001855C5B3
MKLEKVMAADGLSGLAGGLLFAIRGLTALTALFMIIPMAVAIVKVHGPDGY